MPDESSGFESIQSLMDSIIEKHNSAKSKDVMAGLKKSTFETLEQIQDQFALSYDETFAYMVGILKSTNEQKQFDMIIPLVSLWFTQWKQSKGSIT
ncbi:MAG: hypothetical protein PHX80_03955 [Candidatus Nanoarchaeia archaeon]|nr:hypothetical protein [Candidatus Nanoarchaeia archaeon]